MNRTTSPRIHPTAQIGQNVSLGCDVVVGAHAIIYDNVMIGDYSVVGPRVTIGEPDARFYHSDQYEFPSTRIGAHAVIRSGTVIYSGCQVGDGFQTGHYAVIREKTTAGKHCSFGTFAQSDGDCALGDYVRIHYAAHVCRTARIGSFVWIYPYSVLTNDIHPPCSLCVEGPTVEDYAVITTACIILPRVKIGQHALVAANSVVTRDVPAEAVAAGIPAKVVGSVRSIDCDADAGVKTPYPWPTHFERGYPWEDVAWDEWVGPDSVRE
jgi:acetyltransferase-like isoleucine patch superfamily enzyme